MKTLKLIIFVLSAITFSMSTNTLLAEDKNDKPSTEADKKVENDKCEAPAWAIAIGHEDKWKLHNGCTEEKNKKD